MTCLQCGATGPDDRETGYREDVCPRCAARCETCGVDTDGATFNAYGVCCPQCAMVQALTRCPECGGLDRCSCDDAFESAREDEK